MPADIQKSCCMDNGKPAAAYILAVPIENIGLFFLQTLGVYPFTFGGYPGHLVARCCAIGSILHLQLDLLLDSRFLLFHLLDLVGKLLPLIQKSMQGTQVSGLIPVVYLIKLVTLKILCHTIWCWKNRMTLMIESTM